MKLMCTLPNASECINGIKFKSEDGVMVSEDDIEKIPEEVLNKFLSIDGYCMQATAQEVAEQPKETTAEAVKAPARRRSTRSKA